MLGTSIGPPSSAAVSTAASLCTSGVGATQQEVRHSEPWSEPSSIVLEVVGVTETS